MKKMIKGILAVLSVGVLFLTVSCASVSSEKKEPLIVDKVETQVGNIKVVTDPGAEVMMLLLRLAENPIAVHPAYGNSDFNVAVDTWFLKYKEHPSVKTIKTLLKKFSIVDLMSFTIPMNDDLTGFTFDVKELNKDWTEQDGQTILSAVNQFARDTKFDKFYLLNRPAYINMQNGVIECLSDGTVEKYISEIYMAGKGFCEEIHVSELLAGYSLFYNIDYENGDVGYSLFLSPYWSKESVFHVMNYICNPVINGKLQQIPEDTFLSVKIELDKIREKNGLEKVTGNEHKDSVRGDVVFFSNMIYVRDYGKREDYDALIQNFKSAYSEELIVDFEKTLNEYLEKPVADRNYDNDLFTYLVNMDLEMLKILSSR